MTHVIAHAVKNAEDGKLAIKLGVSCLEVDISKQWLTAKFVIQHDGIKGCLGIGPEINTISIPALKDKLYLDLKHVAFHLTYGNKFKNLLTKLNLQHARIGGKDWQLLSKLAKDNDLLPFYTMETKEDVYNVKKIIPRLTPAAGFCVYYKRLNENLVKELKSKPLGNDKTQIWAWTVNDVQTAKKLADIGADGIITDKFKLILKNINRRDYKNN